MPKAVIGAGSNLSDRKQNLTDACAALSKVPGISVLRASGIYETAPWGYTEQPSFYNAVIELDTTLSPEALLGACLGIEAALGRVRTFKNGPRILDLDLLIYEGETRNTAFLALPHPLIAERAFVLLPLLELYPDGNACGYSFSVPTAMRSPNDAAVRLPEVLI